MIFRCFRAAAIAFDYAIFLRFEAFSACFAASHYFFMSLFSLLRHDFAAIFFPLTRRCRRRRADVISDAHSSCSFSPPFTPASFATARRHFLRAASCVIVVSSR